MASVLPMSCTWRDLRVPAEGLEGAVLLVTVERKLINVTFERVLRLKRERTDRRVAAYWGRAETKGAARGDRRSKRRAHSSTYYGSGYDGASEHLGNASRHTRRTLEQV